MADLEIRVDARDAERALTAIDRAFRPTTFLKLVGQRLLAWVNENFEREGAEAAWHPMSPNTRAQRGAAAKLLRDKGRLRRFTSELRGDTAVAVGTNDPKAEWHHRGTKPYTIRPKAAKALRFVTVNGVTVRRVVHHPGLPARPLLPSERLAARLAQETVDAAVKALIAKAEAR